MAKKRRIRPITKAEWLGELARVTQETLAERTSPELGESATEIAQRLGRSRSWTQRMLKKAVVQGSAQVRSGLRRDVFGRLQPTPVYRLTKKPKD